MRKSWWRTGKGHAGASWTTLIWTPCVWSSGMPSRSSDTRNIRLPRTARVMTATVGYVGKANYREAEQYIRDFRLWTSSAANGLTVEISAVNGRFTLDFLQTFSNPHFRECLPEEIGGKLDRIRPSGCQRTGTSKYQTPMDRIDQVSHIRRF